MRKTIRFRRSWRLSWKRLPSKKASRSPLLFLTMVFLWALGSYLLQSSGHSFVPDLTLSKENVITCPTPYIIDGDTFDCAGTRIRLTGIDAPEMPGHCRQGRACTPGNPYAAKDELIRLTGDSETKCIRTDTDVYGRTVARCKSGGIDLSCAMIRSGHAVRRYAPIVCF